MTARFPVVYQPATKVAIGPATGAKALMAWCLANYPPGTNLGIYNPRNVRGGSSLSLHAEGRALDIGYPVSRPDGYHMGQLLASDLTKHSADLGVMEIIFARRIWTNARPTWRPYTGTADHFDHVHIGLTREAAADLTTDLIRQTMTGDTMPPKPAPANPYPAETAEALELLAQHAGYVGDRKWFGPDALAALHRLKNRGEHFERAANEATKEVRDLRAANATSSATIVRLTSERDEARKANGTADLAELVAAFGEYQTTFSHAWDDLMAAVAEARKGLA